MTKKSWGLKANQPHGCRCPWCGLLDATPFLVALLCWAEDMHSKHVDINIYIYIIYIYIYILNIYILHNAYPNANFKTIMDMALYTIKTMSYSADGYLGLWTKYSTARMTCWPIEDWNQPAIWLWINTYKNTIFSGLFTSILTQLFWCEQKGYYWFWPASHICTGGCVSKSRLLSRSRKKNVIWQCFFGQSYPNFICVLPIFLGYGFAVHKKSVARSIQRVFHAFAWCSRYFLSTMAMDNSTSTADFPLKPSFLRDCPASYVWFPRL